MSLLLRPADLTKPAPTQTVRGTYFVQTWGCQMNVEDSEQMALYLEQIGFQPSQSIQEAHVILLNTCSVRKKPEDKAFSLLGELVPVKKSRPEVVIGVCGCMAQLRAEEIRKRAPHVDFVVGTAQISQIPGLVEETLQQRRFQKRMDLPERKGAVVTDIPERLLSSGQQMVDKLSSSSHQVEIGTTTSRPPGDNLTTHPKLKAFVPIQYGCDKFCTFCIVPTTRGRERSRPTLEILKEVTRLAEMGTKEVTLLGQTVNSYGKNLAEGNVPFAKLLRLLAEVPGLERIRNTSPYPRDFKTDLIETIRDVPQVMEHVHMPLQSGDDDMLRAMKRLYTRESFLAIVNELREKIPGIGITTDIIVGFPGETEEQFQRTLQVVEEVRFDGAYMFIYSPRPGTPAASLPQLPYALKQARLKQLADLQNRITCEINETYIGKTLEVLVEGPSHKNADMLQGYSREFKMVHFPRPSPSGGGVGEGVPLQSTIGNPQSTMDVSITSAHLWGLSANPTQVALTL